MNLKNNIGAMPLCDRPYEKIEAYGAEALTDSELLAAIIRCGTKNSNAVDVARNLINSFDGSLTNVLEAGLSELREIEGIGKTKAIQLKALCEIGRRYMRQRRNEKISAKSPDDVGAMLVREMADKKIENFRVILLDKKLNVIAMKDISTGTLDRTIVHPREVFSYAIRELSAAVIVAHNHPSGDITPSDDDIRLTERLISAGEIIGINVLDHFIVGGDNYLSMKLAGLMPGAKNAA